MPARWAVVGEVKDVAQQTRTATADVFGTRISSIQRDAAQSADGIGTIEHAVNEVNQVNAEIVAQKSLTTEEFLRRTGLTV